MPRPPSGTELSSSPRPARDRLAATLADSADPPVQVSGAAGLLGLQQGDSGSGRYAYSSEAATRFRTRTGLGAAAALMVVAALTGGWMWWQSATESPSAVPFSDVSAVPDDGAGPAPDPDAPAAPGDGTLPPETILVHIAGAVAKPGVVELPAGSRLFEAIAAAGGGSDTADPARLNLAAVLADGQKVLVPAIGEPDSGGAAPGTAAGSAAGAGAGGVIPGSGKINLNTADVAELGSLPRVGPVLAQRIVDWRQQHGKFKTVEELDAVEGIGPKMLETLLPLVMI